MTPTTPKSTKPCGPNQPRFPEDTLYVTPWADPVLDQLGHDPRSQYTERYWLPIIGPSTLLLLRRLATELEHHPNGFHLNTTQWASELGIGIKGGQHGPFWRSIERACRFGAAKRNGLRLAVRRHLPPLTTRQVQRLPLQLQTTHQAETATSPHSTASANTSNRGARR